MHVTGILWDVVVMSGLLKVIRLLVSCLWVLVYEMGARTIFYTGGQNRVDRPEGRIFDAP